jgi:hypothetical protein
VRRSGGVVVVGGVFEVEPVAVVRAGCGGRKELFLGQVNRRCGEGAGSLVRGRLALCMHRKGQSDEGRATRRTKTEKLRSARGARGGGARRGWVPPSHLVLVYVRGRPFRVAWVRCAAQRLQAAGAQLLT